MLVSWYVQCQKPFRHATGATIIQKTYRILELLMRANTQQGYKRTTLLYEASFELDLLKIFVRLAKDTHAMTEKNYIQVQGYLQETGKQLGGWIKETKRSPASAESVRGK